VQEAPPLPCRPLHKRFDERQDVRLDIDDADALRLRPLGGLASLALAVDLAIDRDGPVRESTSPAMSASSSLARVFV
jgi:hypothetical protein